MRADLSRVVRQQLSRRKLWWDSEAKTASALKHRTTLINSAGCAARAGARAQADEQLQERATLCWERHHLAAPRKASRLRAVERRRTSRVYCVASRAVDHTPRLMRASSAAACRGIQRACAASEARRCRRRASARGSCSSRLALSDGARLRPRAGKRATARLPRAPERSSTGPVRPARRASGMR